MTISTQTARAQYAGNGVTTSFAVPFEFLTASPPKVVYTDALGVDVTWVLTTNYTITGGGAQQPATGSITALVAPALGTKITLLRNEALTQAADYVPNDPFPATAHEKALDRLSMQNQMIEERLDRSVGFKESSAVSDIKIADPVAGQILGWSDDGTAIVNKTPVSVGAAGATGAALFAASTAAAAWLALGVSPDANLPGRLQAASAVFAGNVNTLVSNGQYGLFGATNQPVAGGVWVLNVQVVAFPRIVQTAAQVSAWTDAVPTAYKRVSNDGGSSWTAWGLLIETKTQADALYQSVNFTQTGTGAVARPLIAKIKDGPVSLEDFAYVSGNALTALNNAIACGQPIQLGPKVYDVNGILSIPTNRDFFLTGWGFGVSALRFTGTTRGLEITQDDYNHSTHIRSVAFMTTAQEPGTGLKVTYSKADSITNRSLRRCSIIDVDVRGDDEQSQGWTTGIHLVDCHAADVIRPLVTGRRDASVINRNSFNKMQYGIRVTGSDTPTLSAVPSGILIDHPRIDVGQNAIYAEGEVEGLIVETPIMVGVINGVVARYTTTRPWTKVNGGHINFFDAAVDLQNSPQSEVGGMTLYKYQEADAISVGVILRTCDDSDVSRIKLINQATSVALNGDWGGIQLIDSSRVNVSGIQHNRPSTTVFLSGTSANCTVRGLDAQGTFTGATAKLFDDTSSGANTFEGGNKSIDKRSNAGAVTATAVGADAVAYSFPFVSKGERFLVTANVNIVTGGTAGDRLVSLHKITGTATAVFGSNAASGVGRTTQGTTGEINMIVVAEMTITASGSLQVGPLCQSTGANSTIPINGCQMTISRL